jgi:hypothetical protein
MAETKNAQLPLVATDDSVRTRVDVYVAGHERIDGIPIACYWKNGEKVTLRTPKAYSQATGIAVSGNDVYVSGTEKTPGGSWNICYWKNTEKTPLTGGNTDAESTGIAVSGSDVYVAGWEKNATGKKVACYWKNTEKTPLTGGNSEAYVSGIVLGKH